MIGILSFLPPQPVAREFTAIYLQECARRKKRRAHSYFRLACTATLWRLQLVVVITHSHTVTVDISRQRYLVPVLCFHTTHVLIETGLATHTLLRYKLPGTYRYTWYWYTHPTCCTYYMASAAKAAAAGSDRERGKCENAQYSIHHVTLVPQGKC